MKWRYKIMGSGLVFLVLAVSVLALAVSYNGPCRSGPAVSGATETMQAVVHTCYGASDVLQLVDIPKPVPAADEVLVRVVAASVNPLDWHYMRGSPYIMRLASGIGTPGDNRTGVDFAGVVESVGANVMQFKPGDEVFGGRSGAFAEYVVVPADRAIVQKPANLTFEEAAAMPIAAVTALQALRDKGQLQDGQSVLINGASGGVGTFAVQIAKAYGAVVTGVSSTRNQELVSSIGADHVIDYRKQDYSKRNQRFDLIVDMVGNHSILANRRVLSPGGRMVIVGAAKGDWIAPFLGAVAAKAVSPFTEETFEMILAELTPADLTVLADLAANGKVSPVIDRRYPLADIRAAIDYSESGRARGKIIIAVDDAASANSAAVADPAI